MARYESLHLQRHHHLQGKTDDFFLVDSAPNHSLPNPPPNFSIAEAASNHLRASLNPSDAAAAAAFYSSVQSLQDEWSGTSAVPDTSHHHWGIQSSSLCGGVWPGSSDSLDPGGGGVGGGGGGGDYIPEKRARIEQPQDVSMASSSFEQDYHHRAPSSRMVSPSVLGGIHAYIGDDNFRKLQALQRQGIALDTNNQRMINALYSSSRPSPSSQGYHLCAGDQLRHRQLTPGDGSILRGFQLDSGQHQQHQQQQSMLQGQNYLPGGHPVYQLQYQRAGTPYSQPRLQVAYGLKPEGMKHPLSLAAYTRCSQVLTLWTQEQRQKPRDNSVQYWRNLFQEFYAEKATQRWCLSCYHSTPVGRHAQGLFPMDNWRCNLCGVEPGRGFEAGVDVLPRLFKIKFDSGLLEELFFLELPDERYALPSGHAVFEYNRAVHESSFAEIRIIKYGRLRVTFNNMFKICSWEFCTKSHEEVVPRRNLVQQVHQLSNLVNEVEKESFDPSVENLKNHCNSFHLAAKQLAVKIDAPSVNDLGFSKRYIRCLQIAEVVNSMEDLIKFSKKTGLGPIESLAKFPVQRKRPLEDSSPQSSITYLPCQPDQGRISSPPPTSYHHHPPPSGHQYLSDQQQQQHAFTLQQQTQDFVAQVRPKPGCSQQQQQQHPIPPSIKAATVQYQSLPGTPQSEMSDLRSNVS